MGVGAYGLPTQALLSLALLQCGTQGILVTLLVNFLFSKSDYQAWFKIYVTIANAITAGQTVIHVIQAFDIIDLAPVRGMLVPAAPVLTGFVGAFVHPFFVYRCWRIYRRRLLAIVPLLLLGVTSFVSAIMLGAYARQSLTHPPNGAAPGVNLSTGVWSFSSLAFDMITTLSTIVYFFRARKDLNARQGILLAVWQILWASAAPPLILMVISIVDEYMIPSSSGVVGVVAIAMMGKFHVLSLMINIVGRGYIRQQFKRPLTIPSLRTEVCLQEQSDQTRNWDRPVVHVTIHVEEVELATATGKISQNMEHKECDEGDLGEEQLDAASLNCDPTAPRTVKLLTERRL
ncbi:hypothetical protein OPQ81_007379 [Rhizoctonia solani]|nr:hypothetical protein OPQ81_007379 [Rhizoctonia solani]